MPRKTKPVASPDKVWIAPRPASQSNPRTFEPVGAARSNRYLEFADIALGARQSLQHKKKDRRAVSHAKRKNAQGKVTPINRAQAPPFGAFRNPR